MPIGEVFQPNIPLLGAEIAEAREDTTANRLLAIARALTTPDLMILKKDLEGVINGYWVGSSKSDSLVVASFSNSIKRPEVLAAKFMAVEKETGVGMGVSVDAKEPGALDEDVAAQFIFEAFERYRSGVGYYPPSLYHHEWLMGTHARQEDAIKKAQYVLTTGSYNTSVDYWA